MSDIIIAKDNPPRLLSEWTFEEGEPQWSDEVIIIELVGGGK